MERNRNLMLHEQGQFKIREIRVYQPNVRLIPAEWPQPNGPNKYIVYADSVVIERIMAHARQDTLRECFGLLMGNVYVDEEKEITWIYLQDAVAAGQVDADISTVEVSREEFMRINEEVDRIREQTNDDVRKIGWYHSHPNYGIFMSNTDRLNQKRYYNQDWQLALVVDPVRSTMGFFRGATSNRCPHRVVEVRPTLEAAAKKVKPVTYEEEVDEFVSTTIRKPGHGRHGATSEPKPGLWRRFLDWLISVLEAARK